MTLALAQRQQQKTGLEFDGGEIVLAPAPTRKNSRDLTGMVFDRLSVLGYARGGKWWCKCECGTIKPTPSHDLTAGKTKSCGCLNVEHAAQMNRSHGATVGRECSPEYSAFYSARGRCNSPHNNQFHNYGKRGIEFRFNSFEEFLSEVGNRPDDGHSLDRIDVNGHYEIGNVRWVPIQLQGWNQRTNHILTIDGVSRSAAEWIHLTSNNKTRVYMRLFRKWCDKCAIYEPVGGACKHR